MRCMGFSTKWIDWICGLLATSSTRTMVNGVPGEPLYNCQGLRQGDPVSSMLFILTMEPLQRMFGVALERGLLSPLASRCLTERVSMFADDVMIFLKPEVEDLTTCATLLRLFGEASGLRVNLQKSAAIPIRCNSVIKERVVRVLGCPQGSYPCRYLGLPLTLRKQRTAQLMGLVDQLA